MQFTSNIHRENYNSLTYIYPQVNSNIDYQVALYVLSLPEIYQSSMILDEYPFDFLEKNAGHLTSGSSAIVSFAQNLYSGGHHKCDLSDVRVLDSFYFDILLTIIKAYKKQSF